MADRVTMSQVAEAAGVNKATVSRALRGDSRISPATHRRVWEAARRLGYEPNALASGLSSRRSGVIGLVVSSFRHPWIGPFFTGLSRVLSRGRLDLLICEAEEGEASTAQILRRLLARQVDGLIWQGDRPPGEHGRLPMVFVGSPCDGGCCLQLARDDIAAEVLMLAEGRPLVYCAGPEARFSFLADVASDGVGRTFTIWDGAAVPLGVEAPDLACVAPGEWDWGAIWRLEYPAMELGVLAGRVLLNELAERGVRPSEIRVRARPVAGTSVSPEQREVLP